MTPRERVLAILSGRKPDLVPWFGDLDYWATAMIGRGERPKDFKQRDDYIAWHRDLGVGFYLQGYFPFKTIRRIALLMNGMKETSGTARSGHRMELCRRLGRG